MITITNPTHANLEETLAVAFMHQSSQEREARMTSLLEQVALLQLSKEGIFRAEESGRLVGALFSQKRHDGTVLCWVPNMQEPRTIEPFFEPLDRFCRQQNALAVLALADLGQTMDEKILCSKGGFEYLSDLLFLVCTLQPDQTDAQPAELSFESVHESGENPTRLESLVKQTYHESRDFPRLMQITPVQDVLNGYRTGSCYHPELWFYVRYQQRDVGVLLMSDQPDDQMELTYMGLIEEVRGRGLSKAVIQFALQTAFTWNRKYLLTTVDENNPAALKSYLSRGFAAWDRKKVYARFY